MADRCEDRAVGDNRAWKPGSREARRLGGKKNKSWEGEKVRR
jgi:hypothetical protein